MSINQRKTNNTLRLKFILEAKFFLPPLHRRTVDLSNLYWGWLSTLSTHVDLLPLQTKLGSLVSFFYRFILLTVKKQNKWKYMYNNNDFCLSIIYLIYHKLKNKNIEFLDCNLCRSSYEVVIWLEHGDNHDFYLKCLWNLPNYGLYLDNSLFN